MIVLLIAKNKIFLFCFVYIGYAAVTAVSDFSFSSFALFWKAKISFKQNILLDYPDLEQKNPAVIRALDKAGMNLWAENYFCSFVYHALQRTVTHCSSFDPYCSCTHRERLLRGFIYLFNPVSCFDVGYRVNLSIWGSVYMWWIMKYLMNKAILMNGVQWDQTRGEGRPLPTLPLFFSFK